MFVVLFQALIFTGTEVELVELAFYAELFANQIEAVLPGLARVANLTCNTAAADLFVSGFDYLNLLFFSLSSGSVAFLFSGAGHIHFHGSVFHPVWRQAGCLHWCLSFC